MSYTCTILSNSHLFFVTGHQTVVLRGCVHVRLLITLTHAAFPRCCKCVVTRCLCHGPCSIVVGLVCVSTALSRVCVCELVVSRSRGAVRCMWRGFEVDPCQLKPFVQSDSVIDTGTTLSLWPLFGPGGHLLTCAESSMHLNGIKPSS